MGYQGLFPPDTLPLLTLPWDLFTISRMEFFGNVNFLKGALVLSDFITTVSKKYSQEIQTTEFGFGLEGVLRTRSSTVTGILPAGSDYLLAEDHTVLRGSPAGMATRAAEIVGSGLPEESDEVIRIKANAGETTLLVFPPRPGHVPSIAVIRAEDGETAEDIAPEADLASIETQTLLEGIEVRLRIPDARAEALESRHRNLTGRTSCGLCGAQALEDAVRQPPRVGSGPAIDADVLHRALAQMHDRQPLNVATGATHAAAWANLNGDIALLREDVGRHNALDKVIGAMTEAGERPYEGFLVVTSRASYEMVQKSATVGIALLAAISAPTALAIHLADETGMTLVGFARPESHVIYTHPERVMRVAEGITA